MVWIVGSEKRFTYVILFMRYSLINTFSKVNVSEMKFLFKLISRKVSIYFF